MCWCVDASGKKLMETWAKESEFDRESCRMKETKAQAQDLSSLLARVRPSYQTTAPLQNFGASRASRFSSANPTFTGIDRSRLTRVNSYSSKPNLIPVRSFSTPYTKTSQSSETDRLRNLVLKMNDVTGQKVRPLNLKGNFRAGSFVMASWNIRIYAPCLRFGIGSLCIGRAFPFRGKAYCVRI